MTAIYAVLGLGSLGLIFGVGLGIAAKKFAVTIDEREEKVLAALPGANCGACGFPGCQAYAAAVVSGEAPVNACIDKGGKVTSDLAKIMGVEVEKTAPQVAVVHCRGTSDVVGKKFIYSGLENCFAASMLQGGSKLCAYGCLGLGSCVDACPFDAIKMGLKGVPVIDEAKCTGCGLCVKSCPRGIISLIPRSQKVYAGCVSQEKGKAVRTICKNGCFGCGVCAKAAPESIEMKKNLPGMKSPQADDVGKAVEKCPAKVLIVRKNVSSPF